MDTVEITKSNLEAAYNQVDDNTKKLLATLFGDAVTAKDDRPVTERIKTFADACRELGSEHPLVEEYEAVTERCVGLSNELLAYLKLRIICAALNEGWEPQFTEDEWRYYPWFYLYTQTELDDMGDGEKQERRIIDTADYVTEYAGFGCANSIYAPSLTTAYFGSRLCLRSSDLAIYCGKQFIKLWADFNLTRK